MYANGKAVRTWVGNSPYFPLAIICTKKLAQIQAQSRLLQTSQVINKAMVSKKLISHL